MCGTFIRRVANKVFLVIPFQSLVVTPPQLHTLDVGLSYVCNLRNLHF